MYNQMFNYTKWYAIWCMMNNSTRYSSSAPGTSKLLKLLI